MMVLQPNLVSRSYITATAAILWFLQSHFGSCSYILALGVDIYVYQACNFRNWILRRISGFWSSFYASQKNISFGLKWLQDCQEAPSTARAYRNFSGACPIPRLLVPPVCRFFRYMTFFLFKSILM